jgi:hypothetical protein
MAVSAGRIDEILKQVATLLPRYVKNNRVQAGALKQSLAWALYGSLDSNSVSDSTMRATVSRLHFAGFDTPEIRTGGTVLFQARNFHAFFLDPIFIMRPFTSSRDERLIRLTLWNT